MLIDNPGLNFHFCSRGQASGLKVLYYIAPQVWAAPGRMRWIQQRVDHVVAILPFEEPLYKNAGVRCTFVGNPLLDEISPSYDQRGDSPPVRSDRRRPGDRIVPGSRKAELLEHKPLLLETIRQLAERHPRCSSSGAGLLGAGRVFLPTC